MGPHEQAAPVLKRFRIILGVAISAALIAWLFWSVDREQLVAQLAKTHWGWLIVAAALAPAGLVARARRWRYLFPPRNPPPALVPAMMIGYMVNNILPLRAGEFVRVYVVARRWGGHFWTAAATLIVERVLDSLCIVLMLGVLIFLIDVPRIIEVAAAGMLVVDVVGVSVLVAMAIAPERCLAVIGRLTLRWPRFHTRAVSAADRFLHGLDGIRAPAHLLPLLMWTVVVWCLAALSAWTALKAADLHLPWLAGWVVLTFVGLGVSVPSAPGYVGVFQFAARLATDLFGVSAAAGLGYGIVFHASQFIPVTLLGWAYLLHEHMSLGEVARVTPVETPPPSR